MPPYTMNPQLLTPSIENSATIKTPNLSQSMKPKQGKVTKIEPTNSLETQTYPEFMFQHMFSTLVVGPTQCGKTYFVQQVLTKKCIEYPSEKPIQVYWFFNQWQPRYDALKRVLKKKILFTQGLPDLSEDLHQINPEYNNILVFDDLMSQATDSPALSHLFTQGRHRNASVILLLQNMIPKGKYNTDISRNALYKVLFRSPGDRKQIDILAEQTFAKDRPNFMKAYNKETEKPFGYIILDNHPRTTSDRQVVADVFRDCYAYPHITKSSSPHASSPQSIVTPKVAEQPKPTGQRKAESDNRPTKKQGNLTIKRKAENDNSKPAKKAKKESKTKQTKPQTRKPRKQAVYKPKFIRENREEQINSEKEHVNSGEEGEIRHFTMDELNKHARVSRNGFGSRSAR